MAGRERIVLRRPRRIDADQAPAPMSWMQRLRRVFAIDIEACPDCGGTLRVIACTRDGAAWRYLVSSKVRVRRTKSN